jgi:hypothetical protein
MFTRKSKSNNRRRTNDNLSIPEEPDVSIVEAEAQPAHYGVAKQVKDHDEDPTPKKYTKIFPEHVYSEQNIPIPLPITRTHSSFTTYRNDPETINRSNSSFFSMFSKKKINVTDEMVKNDVDIQNIVDLLKGTCYEKEAYTSLEIGCLQELKAAFPKKQNFKERLQEVCENEEYIKTNFNKIYKQYPTTFTLWSFLLNKYTLREYIYRIDDVFYDQENNESLQLSYIEDENNWWLRNMYEEEPPSTRSIQYKWWKRTRGRTRLPAVFEMEQKMNRMFNIYPERISTKSVGGIYSAKNSGKTQKQKQNRRLHQTPKKRSQHGNKK